MKFDLNKKTTAILVLILLVIGVLSIVVLYDRGTIEVAHEVQNGTQVAQEAIETDINLITNADDQQATFLGEISQQEPQLATNDGIGVKPEEKLEAKLVKSDVVASPTPEQPTAIISISAESSTLDEEVLAQKSTGADLESGKLSDEEKLQWEEIWELRFSVPIKKNSFEIDFNNKNRLFEVTLKNKTASDDLKNWLLTNDFSHIPDTFFFVYHRLLSVLIAA